MIKYTQAHVNQIFKIPYSTLKDWARKEFFQSTPGTEDERGIQQKYSLLNLYQIALVEILVRKLKTKPDDIKVLMKNLFFSNGKNEKEITDKFEDHFLSIAVKDSLDAELKRDDEILSKEFSTLFRNVLTTVINLKLLKYTVDNAIRAI